MTEINKLDDVSLDNFIEYRDVDKQGKFSYVGKVTKIDKSFMYFEMQTMHAYRQGFYMLNETHMGKLFSAEKPTGWDKFDKDQDAYIQKRQDKREAVRAEETKIKATTKEQVYDLVRNNPTFDTVKLFKLAKTQIGGDESLLKMFINVAIMHQKRATKS